jgi:hypothetical protein
MQQRLGEALCATPRTETILGCMDHCARVLREISVVAFLRQPNTPIAPRPPAKRGRAAGSDAAPGVAN